MNTLTITPRRLSRRKVVARLWAALGIAMMLWLSTPSVSFAQIENPAPDASAPGAAMVTEVLGWLKWAGLAAALAGLLIGSIAVGVGHFGQHGGAAASGRKWILGGMGAAILSGLAWTITTTLYNATV